jgi:hypothetical protein
MILVFRILTILIAVMMFGTAANWIIDPTAAAASLRMDLLTGMGASTQIGDISAFFLTASVATALAQRQGQAHWFYVGALLLGAAAVMRTAAFVAGHAPFGTEFILPEVVMTLILVGAARSRADEAAGAHTEP